MLLLFIPPICSCCSCEKKGEKEFFSLSKKKNLRNKITNSTTRNTCSFTIHIPIAFFLVRCRRCFFFFLVKRKRKETQSTVFIKKKERVKKFFLKLFQVYISFSPSLPFSRFSPSLKN